MFHKMLFRRIQQGYDGILQSIRYPAPSGRIRVQDKLPHALQVTSLPPTLLEPKQDTTQYICSDPAGATPSARLFLNQIKVAESQVHRTDITVSHYPCLLYTYDAADE